MKNTLFFLYILFLSFILCASKPEIPNPGTYARNVEWVKQATRKYSPESWNLLDQYEKLPSKQEVTLRDGLVLSVKKPVQTFNYLSGNNKTELLLSMSTNVHEISHAFYRNYTLKYSTEKGIRLNWDNAEGYIYISPSKAFFVSVPRKILFPSKKLSAVIPHRMKSFRYDTYIEGNTSTQDEGVLGLLNEFHAYYLGSKFTYEMLEPYQISEGKIKGFHNWVSHSQSTMSAYYEFDYFIREYLLYMKKHHREDYEILKSNKAFREAYDTIRLLYGHLIENYVETLNKQMDLLNDSKVAEATIEDSVLWVLPAGSKMRMGTSVFSEDRDKIAALLNSERYKSIEEDFL